MTHARLALSTWTFTIALSLSSSVIAADPPPAPPAAAPTVAPAPAAPPAPPAPAAAPSPPATAPAAPTTTAPAAPATAPAETAASEEDDVAESEEEEASDADASTADPASNPSPGLEFLNSRRKSSTPEAPQPPPDDGLMGSHQDHFHLGFGIRTSFIPHEGYDLFSKDNDLVQISLSFGRTLLATGDTSLDASVIYDWGPSASTARGAETSIDVHRVSLGLEGRYHLFRRLYVFGRLAPGVVRVDADLRDAGADVLRETGDWLFSADLGAGAAFEFLGEARGMSNRPRGFLIADGGYGWTTASSLAFVAAEGQPAPARLEPLELGELALRGGYFRVAAAVTY
jgi:hypothetical protein